MRTSIITAILLISLFTFNKADSQAYTPLAVEGATWIMSGYGDYHFKGWGYRIAGDSVINNIDYKKLYYYDLEVIDPGATGFKEFKVESETFAGLLRDDLTERKVYGYDLIREIHIAHDCDSLFLAGKDNEMEVLIFDFSKTIGDTIQDCMVNKEVWSFDGGDAIIQLDTLAIRYNVLRRVLTLGDEFSAYPELIEGIGFNSGLFLDASPITHAGKGLGLEKYCIGTQWQCGMTTAVQDEILPSKLNIFPNPVTGVLRIDTKLRIDKIDIYDTSGQKLLSHSYDERGSDLSQLSTGTYIIQLTEEDGRKYRELIIKL